MERWPLLFFGMRRGDDGRATAHHKGHATNEKNKHRNNQVHRRKDARKGDVFLRVTYKSVFPRLVLVYATANGSPVKRDVEKQGQARAAKEYARAIINNLLPHRLMVH